MSPPAGNLSAGCLGAPAALLGSTTEIYLHVAMGTNGMNTQSPLDGLMASVSSDFDRWESAVPSNVLEFVAS